MRAQRPLRPGAPRVDVPKPSERLGLVVWRAIVWTLLFLFSLMALMIGMSGAAEAQEAPAGDIEESGSEAVAPADLELLRTDFEFPPQIWLEVIVRGALGTLGPDDFLIEGVEPGTTPVVVPVSTEGLEVVLVVDTSGSMRGAALEDAKSAALTFVDELPPSSKVAVIAVGGSAEAVVPLTEDRDELRRSIEGLRASGETALFDAVALGAELLGEPEDSHEHLLVVLTDGADTASSLDAAEAGAVVSAAGTWFHGVALVTDEFDTSTLHQLAETARVGSVSETVDSDALATVYADLADAVSSRYQVTFVVAPEQIPAIGLANSELAPLAIEIEPLAAPDEGDVGAGQASRFAPTTEVPATVTVAAPEPVLQAEPEGFIAQHGLRIGLGLIAAALAVVLAAITWPVDAAAVDASRRAKTPSLRDGRPERRATTLGALPDLADAMFGRFVKTGRMNLLLERAGLPWRAGEYLVLVGAATVVTAAAGAILLGHLAGAAFGAFGPMLGRLYLIRRAELRKKLFREQLHSSLQLLASNLRVGHALLGALDSVANETEAPTSNEFTRVVGEVRLGRPLGEALQAMAERLDSEDLRWVGEAVEIQRDVGGDLAEVLDNVAETLAERSRLEGQVAALAADGKMSAAVMMALPFVVGALMSATQPDYLLVFIERSGGRVLLAIGIALMTVGGIWLQRVTKLAF